MIDAKLLSEIKIAVLTLALLFTGMFGTGNAGPLSSMAGRAADQGADTGELDPGKAAADRSPLQLALNGAGEEDRRELQELLAVLDEVTEVATKTKMNNDYVPGMVTVLQGDQLEALGAHTVAEALAMVPGIQVARLPTGEPTLKIRGFAFPFNAGNVKVMLNSIALSRESSGINSSVLLTPVAQVDRIEVIRGPGSSIYGDFAMAGVVNIITRKTGGRLFGRAGDDKSQYGGGHYTYRDEARGFDLGLSLSAADDGRNATNLNRHPDEGRHTGVLHLNYNKFSFTAEGVRRRVEFRKNPPPGAPPPPPGAVPLRSSREEESWAMEGRQAIELGDDMTLAAAVSYLRNNFDSDDPINEFKGNRLETRIDLKWSPWRAHRVLIGVSYADSSIDDAVQEGPTGTPLLRLSDIDRRNYALSLQDQVTLNDQFSVTLGARFDDYDDVGSLVTPRIAAVYRLGEHHVLKAQYSQGFRAPTFWELYRTGSADDQLDFEVMDTTELSYIYRRPDAVGRLTLYYSAIDDGIFHNSSGGFSNNADIDSRGVELEWEQRLGEKFRWQANLSYNDTRDGRYATPDHQSPGIAPWLGNLAVFVQPAARLMLTARLLHVGDRYTSDGRTGGYDSVGLTVSRMDLWKTGLTLRVGVQNAFDDSISYFLQMPVNSVEYEYRGRTWWLQLSYDF